jgi:prepilin-type N-terminal cleavage/methylation domain-containing protein
VTRRSFSLIEVVVALSILAVTAGALLFGLGRSIRAIQTQTSRERLDRLFLQAFRFSSVSGHVSDVIISKGPDGWVGELALWGQDSSNTLTLARTCESIGQLSGIHSVFLNDCEITSASFRFFGSHGLITVCAYDRYERELSPADIRFSRDGGSSTPEPELVLTICPAANPTSVEAISLKSYCMTAPQHPPFPNDYIQTK